MPSSESEQLKVGCVLIFKDEISAKKAQELVNILEAAGVLQYSTVRSYVPRLGDPVWYIP